MSPGAPRSSEDFDRLEKMLDEAASVHSGFINRVNLEGENRTQAIYILFMHHYDQKLWDRYPNLALRYVSYQTCPAFLFARPDLKKQGASSSRLRSRRPDPWSRLTPRER